MVFYTFYLSLESLKQVQTNHVWSAITYISVICKNEFFPGKAYDDFDDSEQTFVENYQAVSLSLLKNWFRCLLDSHKVKNIQIIYSLAFR